MSWVKALGSVFGGSGIVTSIEKVALEAIQTDTEQAEAKAIWVKALDPNGAMRREISRFVCRAYGFYLGVSFFLIVMHFFGIGDPAASVQALDAIKATFLPITTAFGGIVGSSFGVNMTNNWKEKGQQP